MEAFTLTLDALCQTGNAWPGRPCCRELCVGYVACTQLLKFSAEGATVSFAAWRGQTVA